MAPISVERATATKLISRPPVMKSLAAATAATFTSRRLPTKAAQIPTPREATIETLKITQSQATNPVLVAIACLVRFMDIHSIKEIDSYLNIITSVYYI